MVKQSTNTSEQVCHKAGADATRALLQGATDKVQVFLQNRTTILVQQQEE